ncbi:MAG: ribulose-phosphate 3-epimerase [Chloroflexi bacterium]|nr:ribulose-phosphate 3-epimerase [Chloroflexota bacterium]
MSNPAPAGRQAKLCASILNANFGLLADQVQQAEAAGVDWVHVDVMDGHFVPNLTMGPMILEAVRSATRLPIDVHLMIERPEASLEAYARAGADLLTVHAETTPHLHQTIRSIHALGCQAGVALCPSTSLDAVEEILTDLDLLLVMTVNPGFGGQALIPSTVRKTARARRLLDAAGARAELQVDGGVKTDNAAEVAAAGATMLVAGTSIFRAPGGVADGVRALRAALGGC